MIFTLSVVIDVNFMPTATEYDISGTLFPLFLVWLIHIVNIMLLKAC